jgi:membrane-associated protein
MIASLLYSLLHYRHGFEVLVHQNRLLAYAILGGLVFVECGILLLPLLPGDTLLFLAGTLVARGTLGLVGVVGTTAAAAVLGNAVNYTAGRYTGPRVFRRTSSRWFRPEYLAWTQAFFERHGGKTVVIARLVPVARTFAPFVAGIGRMAPVRFMLYTVAGAVLWIGLVTGAGYYFGNLPFVRRNFLLAVLVLVVVSLIPVAVKVIRGRRRPGGASPPSSPAA